MILMKMKKKYKIKHFIEKHVEMVDDFKKYNINIQNYDYVCKTFNRFSEFSFYESVFNGLFINQKTFY